MVVSVAHATKSAPANNVVMHRIISTPSLLGQIIVEPYLSYHHVAYNPTRIKTIAADAQLKPALVDVSTSL